jgi:hypothetical protein
MTPGFAKSREELPWLPYGKCNRVIINSHNFGTGDADADAYIAAVEAADGASLAAKYRNAIGDFVKGAKSDGFWTAIKAACFLAGPATLSGALVPLAGSAPTNVSFVSGDYNQATGLLGNGSTKHIDSNRLSDADPQNSQHLAVWVSTNSGSGALLGASNAATGFGDSSVSAVAAAAFPFRSRLAAFDGASQGTRSATAATGFVGQSRAASGSFTSRMSGTNETITSNSTTRLNINTWVFARNRTSGAVHAWTASRLAFYSIGESLNLAQLDARLTTYMAAIA